MCFSSNQDEMSDIANADDIYTLNTRDRPSEEVLSLFALSGGIPQTEHGIMTKSETMATGNTPLLAV